MNNRGSAEEKTGLQLNEKVFWELFLKSILYAEVVDWWHEERATVLADLQQTQLSIMARVDDALPNVRRRSLLLFGAELKDLERRIASDINIAKKRNIRRIRDSALESLATIERLDGDFHSDTGFAAGLAAGGGVAIGGIGLAAGATGIASVSAPAAGVLAIFTGATVTSISLPVFAVAAIASVGLATMSGFTVQKSTEYARSRRRVALEKAANRNLLDRQHRTSAICEIFQVLDDVRDARMTLIKEQE